MKPKILELEVHKASCLRSTDGLSLSQKILGYTLRNSPLVSIWQRRNEPIDGGCIFVANTKEFSEEYISFEGVADLGLDMNDSYSNLN